MNSTNIIGEQVNSPKDISMNVELAVLNEQEQKAVISICILAAFADGSLGELERNEIKRIVENFAKENFDLTGAYQQALSGKISPADLTAQLQSANARALAHEMAVCVCNVDRSLTPQEQNFLSSLRQHLNLDERAASAFQESAASITAAPLREPPILSQVSNRDAQLEEMILNRAILTGALELMPQTLATMAIVPVQVRMVYQIGKSYGYQLDLTHAREFLATVGVGLTSQLLEEYLTRAVRGVAQRFTGRIVSSLATQAAQSALAFVTTYAIGHAANAYYSTGRTLSPAQLRELFSFKLAQGRALNNQYAGQILERSRSLDVADFLPLVKST